MPGSEKLFHQMKQFNTLGAGVPPKFYPNKKITKKTRRDNDMKSVVLVIDSWRRELLIRNKKKPTPSVFFSAPIQKGPKFTKNPPPQNTQQPPKPSHQISICDKTLFDI
jgi:hypothetical protein